MLRSIWTQVWITLVVATVLLAFYTSLGRQLIPMIETQKPRLESLLTSQLGLPVSIGQLKGDWNLLSPVVRIQGVSIGPADEQIRIGKVEAELDLSASAFYFTPVFKRIQIQKVSAAFSQDEQGNVFLGSEPLTGVRKTSTTDSGKSRGRSLQWLNWLGLQQAVELTDWDISNAREGEDESLLVRKVLWRNRGDQHALEGDVSWGREEMADIYVAAELKGDLWPWGEQDGEVYLRVDEQQWTRWIPDELPRELKIDTLRGSMEGWLSISDGDLKSLYVRGQVPEMTLQAPEHTLALTDGSLLISGEREDDDWHLRVIPEFAQPLPVSELRVSSVKLDGERSWQFGLPSADLAEISEYILSYNLLPERFNHYVTHLNLRGQVSDARISLVPDSDAGIDIRATVNGLTSDSYMGIPAFRDAHGSLHMQPKGGVADIQDDALAMHIDGVYQPVWELEQASARFYWAIRPEFFDLRLNDLDAGLKGTRVHGDLAIRIPKRDSDVEYHFALLLGIDEGPVVLQQDLVPDILDPAINEWLDQGLPEGDLSNVGFVLNGHIGSGTLPNSVTTQLYLEAENTRVKYLEEWPDVSAVSGRVFMDAPDLDVEVTTATTLGGSVTASGARVSLREAAGGTMLHLDGQLAGDTSEGLAYLQETPLADMVSHALDEWEASGPAVTDLTLDMLLGDSEATPEVSLTSQLQGASLSLTDIDLTFSDLTGQLVFDTDKGLSAETLRARIFDGPLTASLRSEKVEDSFHILADAKGQGEWQSFRQWADLFLLNPVSGSLNYHASLSVDPRLDDPVHLLVESDLQGSVIDLPAPAGKSADEQRTMTALVAPGDSTEIAINYDGLMRTRVALGDNGVERGDVVFGGDEPGVGPDTGISVRGHIPAVVNASQWWDVWDDMMLWIDEADARDLASGLDPSLPPNSLGNTNPVSTVDITVEGIDAWDVPVGLTRLAGRQEFNEWTMQLNNELARGTIVIRAEESDPIVLLMDFVHIPESEEPEGLSEESSSTVYDPLQDLVPADISAIDFTIQEIYYGTRNFGRWQGTSRPVASGVTVDILDSDMKGLKLQGSLDWMLREGQHATRLRDFQFSANDIENIQKSFRQQAIISGKELDGTINMNWMGSPGGFNAATLNGELGFRVRNGSVNADGTGAMKAFGALNFNSVFRRLRLDFSDLVGSGMAFDTMKGKMVIVNGVATLSEPVTVDGPGGKFLTSGMTDLNTGQLDMKLAVTFPVTSTLPLVAVLAGFAPPVAASIYVTERLIGDELERFTSASYNITGTWEEPEVKLNKAFDNKVDGKTSRSFMDRVLSIFGLGGDD
ncbi:MAG: TIGR02099 family protein [Thalassolituus sp.]|nr:MAG: TIGR02099 family protein [Thalassolituus sp.]